MRPLGRIVVEDRRDEDLPPIVRHVDVIGRQQHPAGVLQLDRDAHGSPGVARKAHGPDAGINLLIAEHQRRAVRQQASEIATGEALRARQSPKRDVVVAQHSAFHLDGTTQLVLMHDDAGRRLCEQRRVAGVVGMQVRENEVLEIVRLEIELIEPIDEKLVRLRMVGHGVRIERVLPVGTRGRAHPGIDQQEPVRVLDDEGIDRMRDDPALAVEAGPAMVPLMTVVDLELLRVPGRDQLKVERGVSALDHPDGNLRHRNLLRLLCLLPDLGSFEMGVKLDHSDQDTAGALRVDERVASP